MAQPFSGKQTKKQQERKEKKALSFFKCTPYKTISFQNLHTILCATAIVIITH